MDNDEIAPILWQDVLFSVIGFLLLCLAALMLHVGEQRAATAATEGNKAPGNVLVEATWPPDMDTDVDLWVQAPGDIPVGYSNKGGAVFNLLRDDLGQQFDLSGLNYESSYSRGIVPGEYTVNLHLYRNRSGQAEVPVTVIVSTKLNPEDAARQVLMSRATLQRDGQERTVFRFRLNADGSLVSGSVNSIFRPLREGKK